MDNDIVKMVNEVFVDSFELEENELKQDATIFEDLGLDSLDIVDLVVALQKKFNVQIRNDETIRDIRTLGDIYTFISNYKNENKNS